MKKLLIVAPFTVVLAACATSAPTAPAPATTVPATTVPATDTQSAVQSFTCEDDGIIAATYSADGQAAELDITLPKVGLSHAEVRTEQAASGSGTRYVNNVNPKTTYDWQTKADYGVMTIVAENGQQYQVNCQL